MWVWIAWGIGAIVVWVVVGAVLGMVIGRVIRQRNQEVPGTTSGSVPPPRTVVPPETRDPAVGPRERPGRP